MLAAGDTILLSGGLGSGKTHFARAVIQKRLMDAGRFEDAPSPTFTLVQTYDDGIAEIWHADLYRLSDQRDISEIGLHEAIDDTICLIEWPDRLAGGVPDAALSMEFEMTERAGERTVTCQYTAKKWAQLFKVVGVCDG